jgi:hypothetical protein
VTWTLIIPEVPPSGNVIKRMAWPVYGRLLREWFWLVRAADGFVDVPEAFGKRNLTLIRFGRGTLDRDNLYASMKPVIDVLRPSLHQEGFYKTGKKAGEYWSRHRIGHGLIKEDDAAHLELDVRQRPLAKGEKPHLWIILEDLTPGWNSLD